MNSIPDAWYFRSDIQAIEFYGHPFKALCLEADPQSALFRCACSEMARWTTVEQAVGLYPDLGAARDLVGISIDEIALELGVPVSVVEGWERGVRPLPAEAAAQICQTFRWPLGILFRSEGSWHPMTIFGMLGGEGRSNE